jgi:NAD(P)-dependent dehydrogenase (short-subunit alcohol dehydrogenase family)
MTATGMSGMFAGRRVVVIGASSGLGRGMATVAANEGAAVVVAARRAERLADVVAEAPGAVAIPLDLRDEASRSAFAASVREELGQIDVLVVASGAAPLRRFAETSDVEWLATIETNLIGVNQTVSALIDLLAPGSITLAISSESVDEPRSHLGAYGASKAALEHSMSQWSEEYPWLRFSVVSLGATIPTEFGDGFGHDELVDALNAWGASGRNQAAFMDTSEVCTMLARTIAALVDAPSIGMPRIVLRSPSPRESDLNTVLGNVRDSGMEPR